jgi:predicted branched-subunit amino acid permease
MGIALGPSLPGGPAKRALQGQAVVDGSWALAAQGDGTFDRWRLFGATLPQFVAWVGGTAPSAWRSATGSPIPMRWGSTPSIRRTSSPC